MRRAVLTLAVVGSVLSALYLLEGTRYSLGTPAEPGPGLFPLIVSGLLLIGFVGTGIEALASTSKAKVAWPAGAARWRVAAIALSCTAYGLTLPYLGHMIAGSLLAFAVLHVMALRSWPLKIALSLGIGVGSYVLFGMVLGVPFPSGILFDDWHPQ
jgi:putative tricarboxylic transport membrane protein